MIEAAAKGIVTVLGLHALLKFAFFFVLSYTRRRAALDRAYGDKPSATSKSDPMLLAMVIAVSMVLFWRSSDPVSLLGGFWVGATLSQLFFHRFHEPLSADKSPPPEVSPIKMVLYAIQEKPSRAWRELVVMTVFIVWTLFLLHAK
jgi:hypothetical protein